MVLGCDPGFLEFVLLGIDYLEIAFLEIQEFALLETRGCGVQNDSNFRTDRFDFRFELYFVAKTAVDEFAALEFVVLKSVDLKFVVLEFDTLIFLVVRELAILESVESVVAENKARFWREIKQKIFKFRTLVIPRRTLYAGIF